MSNKYFSTKLINASTLKCYAGDEFSPRSARLTPRVEKKAWDIGHAIHAGLEHRGKLPPYITLSPHAEYRSKEAKEWLAAEKDMGRIPLKEQEYADVKEAVRRAWDNCPDEIRSLIQSVGAKREEELYTDEYKAMLDLRVGGVIVDYKSTRHSSPKAITRDFFNMHYALQAYHYMMVAGLKGVDVTDFYFLFVCTSAPFEVNAFRVPDATMNYGKKLWKTAYSRYKEFVGVADDDLPGYTRGVVDLVLPEYLNKEEDANDAFGEDDE